jgi:ectoine hydroxylase-related dioxygenase (phytanoyl-CoA dioxygenase family)
MSVENALSSLRNKANKIIKILSARIEHKKYKSICKEKHKIQSRNKENGNDHMRIYIVDTVRTHKQKHNIPTESRTCIAYTIKKL